MKKVFQILVIIVSAFLILIGLIGGIVELTSENTDSFGIGLSVVFILIGVVLLYPVWKKHESPDQAEPSNREEEPDSAEDGKPETVSKTAAEPKDYPRKESESSQKPAAMDSASGETASPTRPWQSTALIISSWIELGFFALGIVFALIFGIAGFKAGEMGTMLGIVMVLALAGITLAVSARAAALWGLVNEKFWASVLTLILAVVEAVMFAFSGLWPFLIYAAFTGWCSVYLLRHK